MSAETHERQRDRRSVVEGEIVDDPEIVNRGLHRGVERGEIYEGEILDRLDAEAIADRDDADSDGVDSNDADDTIDVEIIEDDDRPEPQAPRALFTAANSADFRTRWDAVQLGFVDDPANAVREGDVLVCELLNELARVFAETRTAREGQQAQPGGAATEELRLTLRRCRALFLQLLALADFRGGSRSR
jgi:hypothetical protein